MLQVEGTRPAKFQKQGHDILEYVDCNMARTQSENEGVWHTEHVENGHKSLVCKSLSFK